MTLQQQILKIPNNPEYIYYHDGINGKCYRRTGVRTLSAGREITESEITDDIAIHNANPSQYPVVTYDSCVACQGIDVFYNVKLDQVVVTMESLNQSMEVHNTDNMFEVKMIGAQEHGVRSTLQAAATTNHRSQRGGRIFQQQTTCSTW